MISISLCMIVKNEELTLARCLDSVKDIVDEINIIDTGSTDKTKEIAFKYTDRVYDFKWCDDFAKARNFSFSKATKEYIMWLDADDVILEKDREKLIKLKQKIIKDADIIMLKYNLNLDDNGIPALSYYRERIVKRDKNYTWVGEIHEVIELKGKIQYSEIAITHKKEVQHDLKRNLRIFENMIEKGIKFNPRQMFYYARELYYNQEYKKAEKYYKKFLKNKEGFVENKISACLDLFYLYSAINKEDRAVASLFYSFKFDEPRAEICCNIANYFYNKNNFNLAIYWYKEALNKEYNIIGGGFYIKDCYDFTPYLGLCVCYYHLGNIEKAIEYNNFAGNIKPNDERYLNNRKYFNTLKI